MKVVIIYRPMSAHGRLTDEYIHDFERRHPEIKLETLNIDSRDGGALASLYDIVDYPALMVMEQDGQVLKSWQGETLPLMSEVAAYASL